MFVVTLLLNGGLNQMTLRCLFRFFFVVKISYSCMPNIASSIIYNAEVKENNNSQLYIGLTEPPFKLRYNNHTQSFKHEKHQNSTELSKHIWQLKRNKKPFTINWSIASRAQSYNSESKRCNLCLTEKLHILNAEKHSLLNKRPELISKCRHENKFYLRNFKRDNTWSTTPIITNQQ